MTETSGANPPRRLRLAWVSPVSPWQLDSVTWLATTHELRRLGMDVTLLATGPTDQREYGGVAVHNIERPQVWLLGRVIFHLRILAYLVPRLSAFDFILFHPISGVWIFPLRLFGRRRPLLVMDTRDLMNDPGVMTFKARLRRSLERLTHRLAARLTDGQTAITERLAQLVGIPEHRLWGIWPSGVDPEYFDLSRSSRIWPASGEPVKLVYAGTFLEHRNLLPLIRAVTNANQEGMAFELSVYGNGPLRPAMEDLARQSNGRVRIEQPVPYDRIPELFGLAHIGVTSLPAPDDVKYEASSPLKLFEYMAAGLPVLSVSNRCHTDVVGRGRYAFWADDVTDDAILRALRQAWSLRDDLAELGGESFRAVRDWTWAASARKLYDALEGGLSRSSSKSPARSRTQPA